MKTYILNPTMTYNTVTTAAVSGKSALPIVSPTEKSPASAVVRTTPQPLPTPLIAADKPILALGLDVHLQFIVSVDRRGHAAPRAPRRCTGAELLAHVREAVAQGFQVFCVQESCGFGFVLHRQLVQAGAQSFVITPEALSGKRKTDKLDARVLCLRLSRWLDGNADELWPIRIPSPEEQRRRELSRRRKFLARQIRSLANRGHGQVAEYCHQQLPSRWWGPRLWKKLAHLDPWVLGLLEKLRALILALEEQLQEILLQLKAAVAGQVRPKALGELTLVTLDNEVCDWGRFNNRKAAGSYTGCCPAEHSSGGKRRLGSIDRMGNGRVRALLVEAVWRFVRWQPHWKAAQRFKPRLAGGAALRKKTVVALARLLAIDLWRWRTGRATFQDLGWIAA
jgi:transposase